MSIKFGSSSAVLCALVFGVTDFAYAQTTAGGGVDEIVVTARKRKENLQSTPVAVTALTEGVLERNQAQELTQVENFIPNVELESVNFSGNALGASIRGLSFSDLEKSFDPTVGVSIDGVFLAWNTGALFDLDDVESVEVLRGPQGTLYGRNTIGGTINVRRKRPTGEANLRTSTLFGSHNQFDFKAFGELPVVEDVLAAKVYYIHNESDSFTDSFVTGENDPGKDSDTFGASFLFTPSENFDAYLALDYQDDNSFYPPILNLTEQGEGVCAALGGLEPSACREGSFDIAEDSGFETSFGAIPYTAPIETFAATLEMNWDVGNGTITSVTGFRDSEETLEEENTGTLPIDLGGGPLPLIAAYRPQNSDQFSQEIRFSSDFDGPFNFVLGAYYLDTHYDIFPVDSPFGGTDSGQIFSLGAAVQSYYAEQDTRVASIFGEGTYNLTDTLRITGGLRYSSEKKEFLRDFLNPADGSVDASAQAEETFNDPTWRVIIDNQFTDNLFGYASYSRGIRSGGFNGRAVTPDAIGPYQPETLDSFEIGFRAQTSDNKLRFNPTLFYSKYDDKQEELLFGLGNNTTATIVFNAASAETYGAELEGVYVPNENLNFRFAVGLLDWKYNNFTALDTRVGSPTEGDVIDISDTAQLRRAPKFTFAFGGDYILPIGNADLTFTANYKHTDSFVAGAALFELDPRAIKPSTDIVDISVTLDTYKEDTGLPIDLSVTAFGKDVLADGVGRNGRPFNALPDFYFTNPEIARRWGVEFKTSF